MEEIDFNQITVLLVEDDDVSNFLATYELKEIGIENIDVAENGLEALSHIKTKWPDIIFLDLNMPVMDGFEFLELVSEEFPYVNSSIVILSSSVRSADKENCLKYPFVVGYLEKPLDAQNLKSVFETLRQK